MSGAGWGIYVSDSVARGILLTFETTIKNLNHLFRERSDISLSLILFVNVITQAAIGVILIHPTTIQNLKLDGILEKQFISGHTYLSFSDDILSQRNVTGYAGYPDVACEEIEIRSDLRSFHFEDRSRTSDDIFLLNFIEF